LTGQQWGDMPSKNRKRHHILSDMNVERLAEMYISLADSRAKGFKKWSDAHQQEKLGDARTGAAEDGVIAAPELDEEAATPGE